MHDHRRFLDFPELLNARDLGGYPTRDGRATRWRSLLRSDDLIQLTAAGVQALASYGVRSVIDLRWPEEVSAVEHPMARDSQRVRYRQISLLTTDEARWAAASAGCSKEMWKCAVLDHARPQLKTVLQAIAEVDGAVLFHCVAGKDRTGIVAALLLALADVLPEAIAYDYSLSAERLRDPYLRRYADARREDIIEFVRCPPQGVYNMLAYLARHGGAAGFLEEIGLTGAQIAALRARLIQS